MQNKWYPLNAPPQNDEEQQQLNLVIEKEQQEMKQNLREFDEIKKQQLKLARQNCADIELDWLSCLQSFNRFLNLCNDKHLELKKCIKIQNRNLSLLKFPTY